MREGSTPIRQQNLRIKRQYPQAIVLFRLGDFYETFDEDAKITSRELEIVLTSREMGKGNKVPLAGILIKGLVEIAQAEEHNSLGILPFYPEVLLTDGG